MCKSLLVSALVAAAVSVASPAVADPIRHVSSAGNGSARTHPNHFLTPEDLLVLAQRHDHGWHLGWFNNRADVLGATDLALTTASDPLAVPAFSSLAPGGLDDLPVTPLELAARDSNASVLTVPEPMTLILLGSGLLAIAQRQFRQRRSRL